MTSAARTLAEFAVGLKYESLPPETIACARSIVIDTVAAMTFGATLPWSRIVIDHVRNTSAPGKASVVGTDAKVRPSLAALANGALAHAFELDGGVDPGAGAHPGATIVAPGIPMAQEQGSSGKELLTAIVAAVEVMYRIGAAAGHASEKNGFHAPGLIGVFGSAIVTGLLMKLDAERMRNALGIAGSMSSGLLEFSRSGGMVKRLHMGRASEGGVLAATLAHGGFTGPETVLEGKSGFLAAFAREVQAERLTRALGTDWHITGSRLKRYACHVHAQVPVTATLELRTQQGFSILDVETVALAGHEQVTRRHNIAEPADIGLAQYSVPFCVALALGRDPVDPRSFDDSALKDAEIRRICRSMKVTHLTGPQARGRYSSVVTVRLRDGREFAKEAHDYEGMPHRPLSRNALRAKFLKLTAGTAAYDPERVLQRLEALETLESLTPLFD